MPNSPEPSTFLRSSDPSFTAAKQFALLFASATFALHLFTNLWQAHLGWGYWRDELYYLACGHHLAWGYVDFGPLIAVQARLAETLFGPSLAGIRMFSALAGGGRVFLTGLLTARFGGGRLAQALSMTLVLTETGYLGEDSVLNPGPFESLFWLGCLLILVTAQKRLGLLDRQSTVATETNPNSFVYSVKDLSEPQDAPILPARKLWAAWIAFGILAGIGLLNKPSMAFFLTSLGAALLLTQVGRLLLLRREAILGIALLVLIPSPNLFWQWQNHWPTIEFLHNLQLRSGVFDPVAFLRAPFVEFFPLTVAVWVVGLPYLLLRRQTRYLGLTYALFIPLMLALHSKTYYIHPLYPLLFAAGAAAWERAFRFFPRVRLLAFSAASLSLVAFSLYVLPLNFPIFSPAEWLRYTAKHDLYLPPADLTNDSPLPIFFSERTGWREEATEVRRIAATLSPADRAQLAILCENYGEAGALQAYAPDLPPALAGQNSFYLWGFGHTQGKVLLFITNRTPEDLHRFYGEVTVVGNLDHNPYMLPFERHRLIYLLRDPHQDMATFWRTLRSFI